MKGTDIIALKKVNDLKAGENSHLKAELLTAIDQNGNSLGRNLYFDSDLGAKTRLPGWTNIGDISACLKTSVGLGEVYSGSETPHIAVASKHTRPVAIANGRTQLEATIKAMAGDLNSPFGGFWGFNTPVEADTAEFLNRMFFEGVVAPEYSGKAVDILKQSKRRFLLETGGVSKDELNVFGNSIQPVSLGYFIRQSLEPTFNVKREASVVTGNNGNPNIGSLDKQLLNDIKFAGNAAIYLASNLIFYVQDGAIAGLGDGCGARTVAAEKARSMLEKSAYAGLSADDNELWEAILYDTPFTKKDFSGIKIPLRLTGFSDAFFPKLDGFVETSGIDRIDPKFSSRDVQYLERGETKTFIPKKRNYDPSYDNGLIPEIVVQPGGSLGDKVITPIAERFDIKMAFTMSPEVYEKYKTGEKVTGRRFFGHMTM